MRRIGLMTFDELKRIAMEIREVDGLWEPGNDSERLDTALEILIKKELRH